MRRNLLIGSLLDLIRSMVTMQPVARIFESLSDDQSVILFTRIAAENANSVELRNKMTLTRKQYYSRLGRMIRVGLIKRKSGKLVLTAFGRIVYESQKIIESANSSQWKLKVIDSIEGSEELPKEERIKLLDNLIEDKYIKELLSK